MATLPPLTAPARSLLLRSLPLPSPRPRAIHTSLHPPRPSIASTFPSARPGPSNYSSAAVGPGTGGGGGGRKGPPSKHLVWYREIVPAMLPVIAIGTAIFFFLQLTQTHLSHARSLEEANLRISTLEAELKSLAERQRRQAVRWGDGLGRVLKIVAAPPGEAHRHVVGEKEKEKEEEGAGEAAKEGREKKSWWGARA